MSQQNKPEQKDAVDNSTTSLPERVVALVREEMIGRKCSVPTERVIVKTG